FFSSRRRHTRFKCDWSSDVCSSDLVWAYFNFERYSAFVLEFKTELACFVGYHQAHRALLPFQDNRDAVERNLRQIHSHDLSCQRNTGRTGGSFKRDVRSQSRALVDKLASNGLELPNTGRQRLQGRVQDEASYLGDPANSEVGIQNGLQA